VIPTDVDHPGQDWSQGSNTMCPEIQVLLGASWKKDFNEQKNRFTIALAYEWTALFNMNRMFLESEDGSGGFAITVYETAMRNVYLQGLTVAATFGF
jgi:hypothetical protein